MKAAAIETALDEIALVREIVKKDGAQDDFPILKSIAMMPEDDAREAMTDAVAALLWLGLKLGGVK